MPLRAMENGSAIACRIAGQDLRGCFHSSESAYILINEKKISNLQDMLPLLEKVARSGKPLITIAEGVGGKALATLNIVAVKAPGFGDRRKAMPIGIANLTGGKAQVWTNSLERRLATPLPVSPW